MPQSYVDGLGRITKNSGVFCVQGDNMAKNKKIQRSNYQYLNSFFIRASKIGP